MLHREIWSAIDALASAHGLTPSGLAKRAGLDPTTFNKSKRYGKDGRPRWPSTESLALALNTLGATLGDLERLTSGKQSRTRIPLIGFAEAGHAGFFDAAGLPTGDRWGNVLIPTALDEPVYALEVSGNSMLPIYRPGDRVIVSPSARIEPHDRVVLRTSDGEVMAKEFVSEIEGDVSLDSLNHHYAPRIVPRSCIAWMARIQWVSQ